MTIYSRTILFFLSFSLILSCKNGSSVKANSTSLKAVLHLEIYSPSACYNEILMDSLGEGTTIMGFQDASKKKQEKSNRAFSISEKSDKSKIFYLMSQIQLASPFYTTYTFDAYHFIITINGKKLVDSYSQDSTMNSILKVLAPYVKIENGGQCDFFSLLKG